MARLPARPWAACAAACAALALAGLPEAGREWLTYDRTRLAAGEIWRLWTGHWLHASSGHLAFDLLALVPAAAWLETRHPCGVRLYLLLAPPLISAVLWFGEPHLLRYVGLSGLAVGALVLLAGERLLAAPRRTPWVWWTLLGLLALKLLAEAVTARPLLAPLGEGWRVVPLAHLAGVLSAGGWLCFFRRGPAAATEPAVASGGPSGE